MLIPDWDWRAVQRKEASLRARSEPIREDLRNPPSQRVSETVNTPAILEGTLQASFRLLSGKKKETV